MTETNGTKKPRYRSKNATNQLIDLKLYCEAQIKAFEFFKASLASKNGIPPDAFDVHLIVYRDILERIGG